MLVLLAVASGGVDAVSYLALGHVFTANMTGNTVLLGVAIGQARGLAALRSAIALLGFIVGAAVGAAIVGREQASDGWPPVVTAALALECAALIALAVTSRLGHGTPTGEALYLLIALSALAMGIQ